MWSERENKGILLEIQAIKLEIIPLCLIELSTGQEGEILYFSVQLVDNSVGNVDKCPYFRVFSTINDLWTVENLVEVVIN